MSSLARRSLRTTAAAAGIAAIGVGLAGHAFAAPELPPLPGAEGLDAAGVLEGAMSEVPSEPPTVGEPSVDGDSMSVPGVAFIEMPAVNTADPELPALDAFALPTVPEARVAPEAPGTPEADAFAAPAAPTAPEVPGADAIVNPGSGTDQVNGPDPSAFGQNSVGAMQALDMAALAMEMAQAAAAGESFADGQQIG